MLAASYIERMVMLSVLPLYPVKVLLPGAGTVANTDSFGAFAHAASIVPSHALPPIGCNVAVPLIEFRIVAAVVDEFESIT